MAKEAEWYLYGLKGRAGPMPRAEALGRLARGEIRPVDYAWREGMADWMRIGEIDELRPEPVISGSGFVEPPELPAAGPGSKKSKRLISAALALILLGAIGYAAVALRLPARALALFERPPQVPGAQPADQSLILSTFEAPIAAGPRYALFAPPSTGVSDPVVYLVTNVRGQGAYDLVLKGMEASLTAPPADPAPLRIDLQDHLGKSSPLSAPSGYYRAQLLSVPPQAQPLYESTIFLWGSPDAGYERKLKDFQSARSQRARAELDLIARIPAQATTLIEADLQKATAVSRGHGNVARQKAWDTLELEWSQGSEGLAELCRIKAEFFPRTLSAATALLDHAKQLHQLYEPLGTPGGKTDRAQLQLVLSSARAAIADVQSRIDADGKRLQGAQGYFEAEK